MAEVTTSHRFENRAINMDSARRSAARRYLARDGADAFVLDRMQDAYEVFSRGHTMGALKVVLHRE